MNQSVLVTGAAKNTGYKIAERFEREGYDVFISTRQDAAIQSAAERISSQYDVFARKYGAGHYCVLFNRGTEWTENCINFRAVPAVMA